MPKSRKTKSKATTSHSHSYLVLTENRTKLQFLILALFTLTAFLLYFVVIQDQKLTSLKNNETIVAATENK